MPGTKAWKEKTCPRDSPVMFLRHVRICARTCFVGEGEQEELSGPFAHFKVAFFKGSAQHFSPCVFVLSKTTRDSPLPYYSLCAPVIALAHPLQSHQRG